MHPLIPAFEPFAFDVGPVAIHGFGILVAIGFLIGGNVAQKKSAEFTGDPKASDRINRLVGWLIFGTFVGGHLGDVLLYHPQDLLTDPMLIFRVWEGLSSFGGFAMCVPLCIWFFYREKVNPWPYLDGLAFGFAIGWFFGRMGCFSAHDHPGAQTNFWLGVYGMCPGGNPTIACHDLGLYEALWSGAVFLLFTLLDRKPRFHGFYVAWIAVLYGPFRFFLDFGRSSPVDEGGRLAGLTPAQYGSVIVTLLGFWMLSVRSKSAMRKAA
ncbi:MAG: prolipoprotein diacylglyceryl transferase [Myxococcota bacterium]